MRHKNSFPTHPTHDTLSRTMTFYRRNLPHWHPRGSEIFLTWRLHGSLPKQIAAPKPDSSPGEIFAHYDRILDGARTGPLWLQDPRIAECVFATLAESHRRNMFQLETYGFRSQF